MIKKIIILLLIIAALLVISLVAFLKFSPVFGGKPDADSKQKIVASKNYEGDIFKNLKPLVLQTENPNESSMIDALSSFLFPDKNKNPMKPLPSHSINIEDLKNNHFIWLGHSTVLFKTGNKTIITDPVFNPASPVPFIVKPFPVENPIYVGDLPKIDAVLISHDHYDHLDMQAIKDLDHKVDLFYVPFGIKTHLQRWGVANAKIIELDWYQSASLDDVDFVLTPSRHFSGRGITDRFKTLWGSWVVRSPNLRVYFSGDGGYFPEFKTIGERYGPFDIVFMEDGAYNQSWAQVHMMPEEAAQAAEDLQAKVLLPIHWAKFDLAMHRWEEPAERISKALSDKNIELVTPVIGELFNLQDLPQKPWWRLINNVK